MGVIAFYEECQEALAQIEEEQKALNKGVKHGR